MNQLNGIKYWLFRVNGKCISGANDFERGNLRCQNGKFFNSIEIYAPWLFYFIDWKSKGVTMLK